MVTLLTTTPELIASRAQKKNSIGFVPTMGNLHEGHISLLTKALQENPVVFVSIFVNPKQFGPNEDYARYPRTLENDLNLIRMAQEAFADREIIVYAPQEPQEVFPPGFNQTISVPDLSEGLEGAIRPGHFDGMATVVWKLFDLVKPSTAYFGLKDFQQYHIVKQMVKDLALPIKIEGMPIVREASGLALSSRNQYLSPAEKETSLILSRTLLTIKKMIQERQNPQDYIQKTLQDPHWNYLVLRDTDNFSSDVTQSKNITILAVYQLGKTRLLDNMQVEVQ